MSRDISHDINTMEDQLNKIMLNSSKLGGFDDGPDVRESLQQDVKSLMNLSQMVKKVIFTLREQGDPNVNDYQSKFDNLRNKMQNELPQVLNKLKENIQSNEPSNVPQTEIYNQPLLDQSQLDSETEYLQVIEQEVNNILTTMRELNLIFQQTLDELQKQRHILVSVDTMVSSSTNDMNSGNLDLEKAAEHQRGTTKCLWLILIIVAVVATGIILFCVLITRKHK